ncbi:serine/threonine-protein phosphatase 6 regulatory ankyrin repeat subunit A-like [Neltuma alba]|uniref:serine/threonine-protein phosphatase 6 regulatory ankyrin repeat subunit A-like n=1 Tax=Neltuma alba TaxID=207710 RepID=UPI0010A3FB29|nr:serine/threonine-protein phosphatase 6 regulatory ankyrin repeat subunit A-like [Prosopis alba]
MNENGEESWNVKAVLGAENDRKNTPLHLAAIRGDVKMCRKMGDGDPSLIARRNIDGETPLFLAALHGNKEAFLWLYYLYVGIHDVSSTDIDQCIRNNNDDTILHCAIAEGHADVAIEILQRCGHRLKEMMTQNNNGLSPLHLLAATPSAFESTDLPSRSFVVKLLYHCKYNVFLYVLYLQTALSGRNLYEIH